MTDLSKSSIQQVVDLVNTDNSSTLTTTDISFGTPVPLVDDPSGKNTSVVVSAVPNSPYTGDVTITYNRLDLAGFLVYGPAELNVIEDATINDVVTSFNAHYGANLSVADDLAPDLVVPPISYQPTPMDLVANATSLAYISEVEITVSLATSPLNTIIAVTDLDGLNFPLPPVVLTGVATELADWSSAAYRCVAVVVGDILHVIGGSTTSSGAAVTTHMAYNIATNTHLGTLEPLPAARKFATAAVAGGNIFVFGGSATNTATAGSANTYMYNVAENTWVSKAAAPENFAYGASVTIGDFIYVHPGVVSAATPALWRYNWVEDTWVTLTSANSTPTAYSKLGLLHKNGKLYTQTWTIGVINIYDIATDTWTQETLTNNTGKSNNFSAGTVALALGDLLYLIDNTSVLYSIDVDNLTMDEVNTIPNLSGAVAAAGQDSMFVCAASLENGTSLHKIS